MTLSQVLDHLPRNELIEKARDVGVQRPELMTRVELKDEIIRRVETDEAERQRSRGWFGVARDLVASVIEQGLHMPDAAALVRGDARLDVRAQPPVATVTLAEIYAAQGHLERALRMLDEVLEKEPEHEIAQRLRARLAEKDAGEAAKKRRRTRERSIGLGDQSTGKAQAEALAEEEEGDPSEPPAAGPEAEPPSSEQRADLPADDVAYVVRGDRDTLCVYWELGPWTRTRAQSGSGGRPIVKLVSFAPSARGAEQAAEQFEVRDSQGHRYIDAPGPSVCVRGLLAWEDGDKLKPLAVARELSVDSERSHRLTFNPRPLGGAPREAQRRAVLAYYAGG